MQLYTLFISTCVKLIALCQGTNPLPRDWLNVPRSAGWDPWLWRGGRTLQSAAPLPIVLYVRSSAPKQPRAALSRDEGRSWAFCCVIWSVTQMYFCYILLIFVFHLSEIMTSNAEASLHEGIYLRGELLSACFSKLILSFTDLLNKVQTGRRGEMDPGSLTKHYEYCNTVQKAYIKVKKNGFEDNNNSKTSPRVIAGIKQYHCLFPVFVIYPYPLLLRRPDWASINTNLKIWVTKQLPLPTLLRWPFALLFPTHNKSFTAYKLTKPSKMIAP